MSHSTLIFIGCCSGAWILYWIAMAFRTKRTVERGGFFGYRVVTVAVILGLLAVRRIAGVTIHAHLWATPLALGIATDCAVAAGAAFTVWARIALGRNWSAEVTFKQDHELVETGPYALVRNPIYTGLLLMALGTAVNYGEVFGFGLFAGGFAPGCGGRSVRRRR
jgi:protein-S-isoprenylcysteine O-methyltransferase Ste14